MSPAAVEFQTPMISPSLQSPNIPPFSFTTDMADDRPLNSNGSRRSRPRLAKVRKQLGKSRTVARENGAEFNPFRSKVEDSSTCNASFDRVSDAAAAVSNDVSFDFTWKNRDNVVKPNFDDESETTKREAQVEAEEKAKSGNFGFQFSFSASANGLDKGESIGSSFGVNQSDYVSSVNSEKGEGKVNLGDSGKGECNFVFGTSWRNSNLEESGSGSINGKTVVDDQEEMKVETERVEATQVRYNCNGSIRWSENYVFAFGAGTEKCSGMDDVESNSKDFGNKISRENEDKYASKSCFGNVDPAFELPDEMEKLNINECESVGGGGNKKKYSSMNLNANASGSFVFTSSAKPSSSSNGSSEHIQEQMTDSAASVGADNNDYTISGKGHSEDSASCGNSNSKSFTFQAGLTVNSDTQTNVAASVASFDSQPSDNGASTVGGQRKDESCPSTPVGSGVSFTEFITPNWDPASFKANLYSELNKNVEFNVKSRSKKDKRPKRTRGNLKQSSLHKQVHVPKQTSSQENPRSPECYSPMDFSPYTDNPVADQPSRETSVASKLFFHPDNNGVVNTSHSTDSEVGRTDTSIGDQKLREPKEESSHPDGKCASTCYIFGTETAYSSCKEEEVCNNGGATMASARDGDVFNEVSHESVQHCFAQDQKYFAFSASSSAEANLPSRKTRLHKKFGRKKVGKVGSSTVPLPPHASSLLFNTAHDQERDKCSSESILRNKSEAAEQVKKGPVSSTTAFEEACKMWRSRGNQAYKSGYMSKAEDFYTQGINSVPLSETEGCCIKPLVLCYSNRAAARISLGRIREALEDCLIAAAMDPYFLKVYVRAANCHLMLGEIENAMPYYKKLLEPGVNICLDRRITIEAADGLQKAQKVAECTNRSAELLERKTLEAASEALEIITEGLSTSSHSEKLLGMKAEALYLLRKYEEITQLCEQTLCIAEKNFSSVSADNCSMNMNASGSVNYPLARLWRWHLISKSYFCMGKLEAALDLLQKLEQVGPISDKQGKKILESSISLAATIRELLLCKNAGNEAFRSGKYTEAVEHYTVALSSNIESRPFAAICFCNRAAAHQALGHIADAIADCSLSMALDGNYTKAVSRRAVLHEMIRDYAQAANDLQRLITILQNRSDEKAKQCGSPGRSTGSEEIRQACQRKSFMEEEAKGEVPLDFYLILGVKASDAASDIKKAYRKAALRHHPDKASQFLAKTESGDEGRLWKEIADEVHKDADRLFKMIGEAYAILSDTTKRSEYDHEEEMRKAKKEIHQSSSYRRTSDAFSSYTYRRSGNKQNWHENWKTYGKSHSRW